MDLFFSIEPKCICAHSLVEQQNETQNTATNLMFSENNGEWAPNGHCGKDEYCAGPNIIEDEKHFLT